MAVSIQITADGSQVTQETAKVRTNLSAAFSAIQQQLAQMEAAGSRGSGAIVQGLESITKATQATARATQSMAQDMAKSFKSVEQGQKSTVDGFTLMQGAIRKTTALLATIGVSVGLTGLAKDMIEVASTFETLDVRLRFLTDSVEEFNKARQFILEFAQTTPLQLDEVADAFVRLRASGLDAAKTLPILVDAVSAFGGGNESLQRLIVNLQQMSTQAKVSGQELKDIARGSLVPAFQIVAEEARKMGKTIGDSLAEANISGPEAIALFLKGAQERFKGATLIMATTWTTLVSNLVDQWKIFSDTVIRESGFLNFMKAAAFELFTLMTRLIQGNKTEFVSWGDAVIASMRKASLAVGSLLDLLNGVLQLGTRVQAQFAAWERQGAEVMANLYNSVAQFFGFTGDFTAKVQADIGQATGAVVGAITSGEITAAVDQTFDRLQKRAEEFRKTQEGIQGKTPAFEPPPPAADTGASKATANRLKAEEEQLKASLQRQEALIGASYDERRQLIDAQAADALAQDVTNVKAIAQARTLALRTAAVEEARDLERVRLESVDRQLVVSKAQLQAEIAAHAGKPEQIAKYEAELTTVVQEAEATRAKIREQTAQVEQQTSRKSVDAQIKSAQELVKLTETMEQDRLKARVDLVDEQIALVEAQVDGEVLTQAAGMQKIHALQNERFLNTADLYRREAAAAIAAIDLEVQETALGQAQIVKIREDLEIKLDALGVQRKTQQQEQLNELTRGWRQWVKDVQGALGNFLFRWAEGQVHSIKDVLLDLKSYFFRIIADMIAYAATQKIILPIVGGILGSIGAGAGGGGGGILDTLLTTVGFGGSLKSLLGGTGASGGGLGIGEGVGILSSLKTIGSGFTAGLGELTKSVLATASTISRAVGGPTFGVLPPGVEMEGVVNVGAGSTAGTVLGGLGGAAAMGFGIYNALKATNAASKAAFAASAAAGTAALASTALVAAGVIAASSGWTGIGLIAAAVTAIIGTVTQMFIKPSGPALAVGRPSGLGLGVEGGRLAVSGDLGSRVLRRDKVDPGVASGVQAQLESGITNAVISIVQTINAVALNPAALLGPTEAALQQALRNVQPINSANAKKMEKDIAEQLRFVNVQIVAGLLEPVEMAFNQLRDIGTLEEQLQRLPGTTAGLVQVFKTMNEQLAEIGKSENTDVLRQLSAVKGKVELFGNRIAETAGQVADRIVTGIVERFQMQVVPDLAGQITQFSDLMKASFPALGVLRATQKTLEEAGLPGGGVAGQLGRLSGAIESATQQLATRMVTGILDTFSTAIDTTLAGEITQFTTLMSESFQALGFLRSAQKTLEQAGLSGAGIAGQLGRLTQGMEDTAKRLSIQMVSGLLERFGEQVDTDLAGQITRFSELMGDSLQALGFLRAAQQGFEQQGLSGAGIGEQIVRLMQGMAQTAASISTELVTTAMQGLSANLDRVLIQPLRVQATTVTSVFTDSLAALQALTVQRVSLSGAGVDVSAIERQIERLVGALLTTSMEVFTRAFSQGDFATFLDVLAGIPESIMALNPAFQRLQQLGALFGEVVGPNVQKIIDLQDELRSTGERVAFTGGRITELAEALRQAGGSAEASLPLYKQLADVLTANAEARIAAVHEIADMERDALATRVEGYRKALDEWVQAEQKALDLWVETQSQALDEWVKTATKQLDAWVDTMTKAVNDWADSARTTADQLKTVNDILFQEKSPAAQQAELEAEKARLIGVVQGGGPDAGAALTRLIDVQRGLLEVAKRGDDLGRQRKILDELEGYRKLLTDRLIKETGESDPFFAQLKIQREQEQWLKAIAEYQTGRQEEIHRIEEANRKAIADYETFHRDQIFQAQAKMEADIAAYEQLQLAGIEAWEKEQVRVIQQELIVNLQAINSTLAEIFKKLPGVPDLLNIQDRQAAQRGGIIGLASGAYVPALLEPGERVFNPPLAGAQKGALVAMNRAFPRFAQGGFTVPGSGSGDTVPAMLPRGSFVLNRRASGAMGYQGGGTVSGGSAPVVNIHIAKLEVRNDADIKAIIDGITKQLRREWRSSNNSGPFR